MPRDTHSESFGGHLREARERRKVTLRTIADATRISVAALEGLERNDISKLPGGIFSRAFVRAYAHEVGLDPDATVDRFVRCFPDDSVTDGHPAAVRARIIDDVNELRKKRQPRLAWGLVAAVPALTALLYITIAGWPGLTSAGPAIDAVSPSPLSVPCAPPFHIELRARSNALISYAVDGQPPQDVSLPTGSRRAFQVSRDLDLRVDDAAAVELLVDGVSRPAVATAGAAGSIHLTNLCREGAAP